jgi:dTDP-4-dehydrorhamnose reductase
MYSEEDVPDPVNFYGKTKKEAEEAVKESAVDWAIARTVLMYGKPPAGRGNLLTVVKEKLEKGEVYSVVDDQVRTPTYVEDLATGIVSILERRATGIYHLSGNEQMTPYEMARKTAEYLGLDKKLLKKVTAADFSEPARRPLKTGFIIEKAKRDLGYEPISFREGLARTFQ